MSFVHFTRLLVYLDITFKSFEILQFWGELWKIETFHRSKFSPATGVTALNCFCWTKCNNHNRCRMTSPEKRHRPVVPKVVKNGLGHPSTKKSMVPLGLSDGPNTHPNIDTNPRIYRPVDWSQSNWLSQYRRSIGLHSRKNTVDINGR